MPSPPDQELREFHRIRFPISERPTFVREGKSFDVIDVSVRGLRYASPGQPPPNPHDSITGILHFRRGARIKIDGTVVRVQNGQIALRLNQEIPFAVLLAEQRYLHSRYPMWS